MTLICLLCLTVCEPVCTCSNAAALKDSDETLNIYVEDIRTVRLAIVYRDPNGAELYRELQAPFDTATYVSYKPVKDSHLNFQPFSQKNDYVRKHEDTYDRRLMAALDKYRTSTASPWRVGSTKNQPNKRTHSNNTKQNT